MTLKLLVFGLPGGGKSTITHSIATYLKDRNWTSFHFSDHVILRDMYLADRGHKQFRPSDHDGFDVLDTRVYDTALQSLEQKVNQYLLSVGQEGIILIEFARNDYQRAFQQFSASFLQDAYFLYLDVEIDVCKRRVQKRIANRSSGDDFYVSEYIFNSYYFEDDGRAIQQILANDHGIEKERVIVIDNNGSLADSIAQVYQFVDSMCGLEPLKDS
jgi:adenylate kinase family enzyme